MANLGFPYADVESDGAATLAKVEGTGGCITLATAKEQLLYELHDPARYLTPDVTADFTGVRLAQAGQDVVRVTHRDSIEDMVRLGKDVEKMALARGLRYHLEDRVLVHDNKTVVFD